MNINQAARLLNVHPSTLYKWVDQGRIRYVDLGGEKGKRRLRFKVEQCKHQSPVGEISPGFYIGDRR